MTTYFYSPKFKEYARIIADDKILPLCEIYNQYGGLQWEGYAPKEILNTFYTRQVSSLPSSAAEECDEFESKYKVS